jgi:putative restriction endonuclease
MPTSTPATTRQAILRAFDGLRVWQRGDRRAVHKPLLVLFELGRLARGEAAYIDYNDLEPKLIALLDEFGPSGAGKSRHYPFWHLRTDGLWELHGPDHILVRPPGATPTITELRTDHVKGRLPESLRTTLASDPELLAELAHRIVMAHFADSIQQDVLDAVGLTVPAFAARSDHAKGRRRDPGFREQVLLAYEYRCCVCGHDLRLNNQVIGLEAAHIKWFQAGGPDAVTNGLALCSLHHKIFDLGAFTVLPDTLEVRFSQHVVGSSQVQARLLSHHGAGLIAPQSPRFLPRTEFLQWHHKEVFKQPARD